MKKFRTILGVNFFVGPLEALLAKSRAGGLIVVPSAPGLAELGEHIEYRHALKNATFAITDSSLLILLWLMRKGELLVRNSGLKFLRGLLAEPQFRRSGATYWVMPSPEDQEASIRWLNSIGITLTVENCFVAPHYRKGWIQDNLLLARIEEKKPNYIIINIGGGTQEILGYYLLSHLSYKPTIICTGAAIAFLSGRQANIPPLIDRLMLGWLARCFQDPRRFVPRYLRAFRLLYIVFKYADKSVAVKTARV